MGHNRYRNNAQSGGSRRSIIASNWSAPNQIRLPNRTILIASGMTTNLRMLGRAMRLRPRSMKIAPLTGLLRTDRFLQSWVPARYPVL